MKRLKKIFFSITTLSMSFMILVASQTFGKYTISQSAILWRTNFAKFTNVTDDVVLGITGQTADNPKSMFDEKAEFYVNGSTQDRWTNWSSTGENRGETVGLHINYVKESKVSKLRLYHFVDHVGCDLPLSVQINYTTKDGEIKTIVYSSLEDLDRNFSPANGRTSIFREYNNNILIPKYIVDGVEYDYTVTGKIAAIYTNCTFDEIITDNINIVLQCNTNWYVGLLEIAMNWEYTDGSDKSQWCDIL